jgi:hypothetical protein
MIQGRVSEALLVYRPERKHADAKYANTHEPGTDCKPSMEPTRSSDAKAEPATPNATFC